MNQTFREFDALHIVTTIKSRIAYARYTIRNDYIFKRLAVSECTFSDGLEILRQGNLLDGTSLTEQIIWYVFHIHLREIYLYEVRHAFLNIVDVIIVELTLDGQYVDIADILSLLKNFITQFSRCSQIHRDAETLASQQDIVLPSFHFLIAVEASFWNIDDSQLICAV